MNEAYVIMRFDVDYNGYSQEPVGVMLEDTYEQRVKAAVECGLYNELATKFAEDRRWESHDGCTGYFITKVDLFQCDNSCNVTHWMEIVPPRKEE